MKVMILVVGNESGPMKPPTKAEILAMHEYNEELQKAGVLLDLGGLTPTSRGVRLTVHGGKRTVIDGPFAEAKEVVVGYQLLEVKDLAEAVEWAKRAPMGPEGWSVEIRPLFDASDFDPGKGV